MRQDASLSSEDEGQHVNDAILVNILEKLKKLDVLEQIDGRLLKIETTVSDMERGLNSLTEDVQKVKADLGLKADIATVEMLKDEIEELQNRPRLFESGLALTHD